MRKIIISVFAALLSMTASAQKLEVASKIDLGQVKFYSPATATFLLQNTGNEPIAIDYVETGCGCAKASYSKQQVAPGKNMEVKVTYNARTMGHFDRIIDVYTVGNNTPILLELKGHVVENVEENIAIFEAVADPSSKKKVDSNQALPEKIGELYADCNNISFDDVPMGEIFQQKFHIYNPTNETVEPQLLHMPKYITAQISPSRIEPKHTAEVTVTFNSSESISNDDIGLLQNYVYLAKNPGDKVGKEKQMTISAVITPSLKDSKEFDANDPHIILSSNVIKARLSKGKKKSETIAITNMGEKTLEIKRVQVFTNGIFVSLDNQNIGPKESARLKVDINSKEIKKGQASPRILLVTNDPAHPTVFIDILDEK